jgi:mRNA interferase MazF
LIRKSYVPRRGDLVWIDFDPQAGHEQSRRRPAAVLSPQSYNEKVGLALVCPVTSKVKGYPWEVGLPDRLQISGVILADLVKSLDWRSRSADKICTLPLSVVTEVLKKLGTLLDEPSRA